MIEIESKTEKEGVSPPPWSIPWPPSELEAVAACPVCGDRDRRLLHDEIVDNVFFVAKGKWTLYRCRSCRSAYLDPRPNPSSIGGAYGSYYTHSEAVRKSNDELSAFNRIKRSLANGYANRRYGTQRKPASDLGILAAVIMTRQREMIDATFRYLPKPDRGSRLLDVGCGNGEFLLHARDAGWAVSGLEPDPVAADIARRKGLDVRVGILDDTTAEENAYDAITLSHVIEHVHQPKSVLMAVHRLLKPGAIVYIDTPNIGSHGAERFGKNWRGIEAPRHLVLFNPSSLSHVLTSVGFEGITKIRRTSIRKSIYSRSTSIAAGENPYGADRKSLPFLETLGIALSHVETDKLEFITLTARKRSAAA